MTPPAKKKAAAKKRPVARVARATPPMTATVFTDRRIALLVTFLALVIGSLAAASTAGFVQSRTNNDVLGIIKDSVDPGGKRFQAGQERTASAVGSINEVSVYASYCAQQTPKDLAAIQGCVRAEYARAHPTTTTTAVP